MRKISKLTSIQVSKLKEYREKWIRIGLSTEPCIREVSEAAVAEVYGCAGLSPPRSFMWFRSPLEGATAAVGLSQVGNQVGNQVWAQVWAQVRDQVGNHCIYGAHDAYRLGFYDYFSDVCKINLPKLSGLRKLAKTTGWVWCFANAAILTERPKALYTDDAGKPHRITGPAIEYSDGWGVWLYHGTRMPNSTIAQLKSLTLKHIEQEHNPQLREFMFKQLCFYGKSAIYPEFKAAVQLIFDDLLVLVRNGEFDRLRATLTQLQRDVIGRVSVPL